MDDEAGTSGASGRDRVVRLVQREALRAAWRAAGWYGDVTIGEAIAAGALARPDDRIVFDQAAGGVVDLTLSQLVERADTTAHRLRAAGVAPGDAVVVHSPTDAAGVDVFVALWLLGAVVVPLVATAGPDEIALAVAETGARVMVTAQPGAFVPGTNAPALAVGVDVALSIGEGPVTAGAVGLATVEPSVARPAPPTRDPSAVACVLYTSGSTGVPKGVRHSHETLLAGIAFAGADSESRTLTSFPAGHVASILGSLRPFISGGLTVVLDRWSARRAAAAIETYGITTSAGTPFYLATLLDEVERSGRDISTLSRFLVGAAAVSPALVDRAERAGIVTWRTYGSTEHPAISGGAPDHPADKRRLTDGKLGAGNEIRLVDERGIDVPLGEEGEILVRGPRQFLGYQHEPLDDDAFVDGSWFRTGDQGRLDADGHLTITDRLKDIIIRGGENISAREVEDVLAAHEAIDEVAVLAAPDDTWGEVVCAVVTLRPDDSIDLDQLRTYAADAGLAAHKLPARLVVVDDFPRTAAGKVRKRDLRVLF